MSLVPKEPILAFLAIRYWSGTGLQSRLMRGVFSNANDIYLFIMRFLRMSFHFRLVPVQYRGHEYGLFLVELKVPCFFLRKRKYTVVID